jgi:hypothetical protein
MQRECRMFPALERTEEVGGTGSQKRSTGVNGEKE